MTHTPGPWRIRFFEEGPEKRRCFLVQTEGRITIAENRHTHDWKEAETNAALIAAAPEMLEALEDMLKWARRVKQLNPGPEIVNALNAIAKAKGGA
jgi:hypothetical protein